MSTTEQNVLITVIEKDGAKRLLYPVTKRECVEGMEDLEAHLKNTKGNPHGVTAAQAGAVPVGRTVNGKALSGNITLLASDVGAAPSGYGLGGGARNIDSVLSITENGWYITNADAPTAGYWICHAFVTNNGNDVVVEAWNLNGANKAKINKRSGTWGKWEWINPPMATGVEYRTTERFGGKPVYQKIVNFGTLPNTSFKTVAHGVSNMQHLLYKDCTAGTHHFPANCAESGYIGVVDVYVDDTSIQITTSINWSAQTGYVKMKYTKTTD